MWNVAILIDVLQWRLLSGFYAKNIPTGLYSSRDVALRRAESMDAAALRRVFGVEYRAYLLFGLPRP